jgi:O-antigen ligase
VAPAVPLTIREAAVLAPLVAALVATALLLDPRAHASFDAPKRLAALVGAALASLAGLVVMRAPGRLPERWRALPAAARAALLAAVAGVLWFGISSVLSPRARTSVDTLRTMALLLLLVPVGASRAVGRGKNVLVSAFLGVTALNAAVSLLQSRGMQPFRLETFGTRNETGAFAGNVGYLTLTVAFASVLAIGIAVTAPRAPVRAAAAAVLLLLFAALLANRNLTALASLGAGALAFLVARFGRRSLAAISAAAVVLLAAVFAIAPLRARAADAVSAVRGGDWDRLTTYRTGAWAAAVEMARARPVTGWGPGTYASEFVPHRLSAEIRAHRRFVNPLVTSSYSEAHCDYLQAFAEGGVPGGVAVLVATGAILVALGRKARAPGRSRIEAAILFGFLVAGAAAALTWFPLQRPISAVPLLLAVGRGWRLSAGSTHEAVSE